MARVRPTNPDPFVRQSVIEELVRDIGEQLEELYNRSRVIEAALSNVLDTLEGEFEIEPEADHDMGLVEPLLDTAESVQADAEVPDNFESEAYEHGEVPEDEDDEAELDAEAEAEAERLRVEAEQPESQEGERPISPYARRNESQGLITEPPDGPKARVGEPTPGAEQVLGDFQVGPAPEGGVPGRQVQPPRGPEGEEGWSGSSPA